MKYLLICLLIGGYVSPAWSQEHNIVIEEAIQKLEETKPWTYENVEAKLGLKFTETSSNGLIKWYTAYAPLPSVKGLVLRYIKISLQESDNKPLDLEIGIDGHSNCFSSKQIERLYPNGSHNFEDINFGWISYISERLWGSVSFNFNFSEECLMSISVSEKREEKK